MPQIMEVAVRECVIESVVVYGDRAEVKRAIPVSLAAGENEVVVQDLAECVDKNSIRFVVCVPRKPQYSLRADPHKTLEWHN